MPAFSYSASYATEWANFKMSEIILYQGKVQALLLICLFVFVATFFKNACRYFAMYFIAPIRVGVVRDIRNSMMKKTLELPLSYFSEERKGDIISRMTTDAIEIEWSIMQTLESIFREPVVMIISLVMLIVISPYLTLYVFLLLPVAAGVVAIVSKSIKRRANKSKEAFAYLFNIIEETLGSLKVIKAFTGEAFVEDNFKKANEEHYNLSVKLYRKTDLTSPVSETVVLAVLLLILFIGGCMVFNGVGDLSGASFLGYFAIASQIVPPIKQLTLAYNNIQKGLASEERIDKILSAENTIVNSDNAVQLTHFSDSIEFKNMSFSYKKEMKVMF